MEAVIRDIAPSELKALLDLYRHLHAVDAPPPDEPALQATWRQILDDPKLRCFVADVGGAIVASCMLVIVPNLTRGARPYGIIENVVTHAEFRRRGIGTKLLRHALEIAWEADCYKVMLLTGSKSESVHRFYEKAGFAKGGKTGYQAINERSPVISSRQAD